MAPSSNAVVGIDDDQRFALMKFRRSVKDVLKPEHNDHYLLRWLRARQWDPEAAEKMLRDVWSDYKNNCKKKCAKINRAVSGTGGGPALQLTLTDLENRVMQIIGVQAATGMVVEEAGFQRSQKWREKWGIDTTLQTWQAPEVLSKHFPSGSTGFDKEGSPVIIVPFVGLDVWGLLHSVTKTDVIRMILRHLENYLATARKQAETLGPAALKVTVIFDLEGFNIKQYAWKPAAEMVFSLLQLYEANYPEILKVCYIVNAPKVFSLAFSVIKKFMHEYTISKIKIFGSDAKKWQAQVLTTVDKEQLPQHYGGTMVDDNGDPRCSLIVKPGGKVPKSYYSSNQTFDSEKEFKRVTIKTGEKHVIDLLCSDNDSVLKWECGVDHHDIKFVIKRRDEEGAESVVHGPRKLCEGPADVGVLAVSGPATYSVIFDNKSAFLRNKKIYYDVFISVPTRDLNISDDPTDEAQTAAACSKATAST